MRIIIDVMSEHGVIPGLVSGEMSEVAHLDLSLLLVGDQHHIQPHLNSKDNKHIEIVDVPDSESSLRQALELLEKEDTQGLVTTKPVTQVVTHASHLPRLSGIHSLLCGAVFMNGEQPIMILDTGVTPEADAKMLIQFAQISDIYQSLVLKVSSPRIGILSNGEEEGKGTQVIKEAGELLQKSSLNYVGNVEPYEVIRGDIDIVLTDGYTGDIFLKTFVPGMSYLSNLVRHHMGSNVFTTIGKHIAHPALQRVEERIGAYSVLNKIILGATNPIFVTHDNVQISTINDTISQLYQYITLDVSSAIQHRLLDV